MATLINVEGAGRTGTTMVDLMLGNAPNAFSCGEVSAWFRPWRTHHNRIVCSCGEDVCPVWEKIKHGPEERFHANVAHELGIEFVIDSSKDLCWLIDKQKWAANSRLKCYNLLMWKDPVSLAYSHWKRGSGIPFWRARFVDFYGEALSLGVPFYAVSHAVLADDPQGMLSTICERVGMPYFEGKERFWDKHHHHLFGSLGTRRQAEARTGAIRKDEYYPPEFEAEIADLGKRVTEDREVQEILRNLNVMDVANPDLTPQSGVPQQVARPYPARYYLRRVKQKIRRHFPQEWEHIQ